MKTQNQLSRYGAISRVIPKLAPGAKVFLVGDSDDTTSGVVDLAAEFPVDNDGVVRVYTTIQAAVNAASANRGDVVLVAPDYDHVIGRVDTWATAGVKVIGLGEGGDRPKLRYTTATDKIDVAANDVTIENLEFVGDVTQVVVGVELDTGFSGHVFRGNKFSFNATGEDFKTQLHVGSAHTLIEDNLFTTEDTAAAGGSAISIDGGYPDYLTIRKNTFIGYWDTNGDTTNGSAALSIDVTHDSGSAADTVLVGLLVEDNKFVSLDTAASVVVNLAAGAVTVRGAVINNAFAAYDSAAADTAMLLFGTTGGALALGNWLVDGDSDVSERLVGRAAKFIGIQDS